MSWLDNTPDREDPPDTGWVEECRDCGCDVEVDELCGPVRCIDCKAKSLRRHWERPLTEALMDIVGGLK